MDRELTLSSLWKCVTSFLLLPSLLFGEVQKPMVFVGAWERAKPLLERASREVNIPIQFLSVEELWQRREKLSASLVFLLNLHPAHLVEKLAKHFQNRSQRPLFISLDERDSQAPFRRAKILIQDPQVRRYWRYGGLENLKGLLLYARHHFLKQGAPPPPPAVVPAFGVYHPEAKTIHSQAQKFLQWYYKRFPERKNHPWVVLIIHQSFWVTGDVEDIRSLIQELEKRNINTATVFADSQKRLWQLTSAFAPRLLLLQIHSSLVEGSGDSKGLSQLEVPMLKPISLLRATVEEWEKDPRGLTPGDLGLHILTTEPRGVIEPLVIGGLVAQTTGFRIHRPIPERIRRFADRVEGWLKLQNTPSKKKRVAIIYYNQYLGKSDLLRGSPTGAYLDGPKSLVRLLKAMKQAGYKISKLPKDEKELLQWILKKGRNIAPWAKQELASLIQQGEAALIPKGEYLRWFRTLPEELQKLVVKTFGPPPGKLMVYSINGIPHLVIPKVDLENVILLPQPVRGERQDAKLLHSRKIPPPHNYIAFYFWLRKKWRAHAVIHFGTHGSLELLPLKGAGLGPKDWGDLLIQDMPNIYPWILDNLGEATLAKRRSYAVLIDHLVPPIVSAGLSGKYKDLHDTISRFRTLEEGVLKEQFRKSIHKQAKALHLLKDLGINSPSLSDEQVEKILEYLHSIENETTPKSLHVLGQIPKDEQLIPYITTMLGKKYLKTLQENLTFPPQWTLGEREKQTRRIGESLLHHFLVRHTSLEVAAKLLGLQSLNKLIPFLKKAKDYYQKFQQTPEEIHQILRALEGKFIPPGSGNDPVRNPGALPTGRNLYAFNPKEIPVPAAWETAKILVQEFLKKEKKRLGRYPRKVAFDLNGHETMRHFGVTEGQILYLLGVKPVWNEYRQVVDVELIPREQLKRPRIDVFIAIGGSYRDNFPSRVLLLDKAVRLVAKQREKDNYVLEFSQKMYQSLLEQGFSKKQARHLSFARIFGAKPGEFGTRILHLIPRSGVWDKREEITKVYLFTMSHIYTQGLWGKPMPKVYRSAMQGTEALLRTWASNMTSPLTNHHVYEYLGGLNLAVRSVTGKSVPAYVADVRDPRGAKLSRLEKILTKEFRVRLLNPAWIKGMMQNGYAGAGQMAELVKNTFGWKVTKEEVVSDHIFTEILETYIQDKHKLGLKKWFERENPYALQEIAATLLEAARKKLWKASQREKERLASLFVELTIKHGLSQGLITGGNQKLWEFTKTLYERAPGKTQEELEAFLTKLTPSSPSLVQGQKLKEKKEAEQKSSFSSPINWILFLLLLLFLFGFFSPSPLRKSKGSKREN